MLDEVRSCLAIRGDAFDYGVRGVAMVEFLD
jgi:hypothetical protein